MNLVCCQLDIVWENKAANHDKVRRLLDRQPAPPEGSLVVLPEMFATGFSMNVAAISDSPAGDTKDFLQKTAAEFRVYLLGGVVTTNSRGRGQNECVLFSPEGVEMARYCKLHPFTFGSESQHYEAGSKVHIVKCAEFNLAPFICYDLRFPEVFRAAVRREANLLIVIANWPKARASHWTSLLKARAIENQAYVAGVNRCGDDPKLSYPGRSMIIDPRGEVIAEAGDLEGTISAELNLEALISYRQELPFLNDLHASYERLHEQPSEASIR